MIKVLGQTMTVRRYQRGERCLHQQAPSAGGPVVFARVGRICGRRDSSLTVYGLDEAGVQTDLRVECRDLRDAEVVMVAALERRGLVSWIESLLVRSA